MKKAINIFVHHAINNGWTLERYCSIICIYDNMHHYVGAISKDPYRKGFSFSFTIGVDDDGNIFSLDRKTAKLARLFNYNNDYRVKATLI